MIAWAESKLIRRSGAVVQTFVIASLDPRRARTEALEATISLQARLSDPDLSLMRRAGSHASGHASAVTRATKVLVPSVVRSEWGSQVLYGLMW